MLAQQGSLLTLSQVGATRTAKAFYDGSFGVYGSFQTSAPPSMEALFTGDTVAGSIEGYLTVVRIGDVGMGPASPSGPSLSTSSSAPLTRR